MIAPFLSFKGLLGGDLEIDVDRQFEWLAGDGFGFAEASHFASVTVDEGLARAVGAHQHRVVLALDARNSDDIARVVKLELRLVQHVFADFARRSRSRGP